MTPETIIIVIRVKYVAKATCILFCLVLVGLGRQKGPIGLEMANFDTFFIRGLSFSPVNRRKNSICSTVTHLETTNHPR